jgi:hypothetical protein
MRRAVRRGARTLGAVATVGIMLSACGLGDDATAKLGNPCESLSSGDVQGATGQATQNGQRGPDNVCAWHTDGGGVFSVSVNDGGNAGFESAIRTSSEGSQVSGLGEKAFFAGNSQFAFMQVLKEEKNLRLDYSGPGAPDQAKMTELARKALEHV